LSNADDHTLYAVGRIVKAFGIRGEMVVAPMTADSRRFNTLRNVFVGPLAASSRPFTVSEVRPGEPGVRLRFAEVPDRTAAERLAGQFIFVGAADRIAPPAGSYFVDDVIGMSVVSDDGGRVGTVREVLHLPAHDVYVVDAGGREVMIPAVPEFVLSIDPAASTMRVHLIDGMLE